MTDLRTAMLQLLRDGDGEGSEAAFFDKLAEKRSDVELDGGRAALAVWHDLYREGVITWGATLHIADRRGDKQRREATGALDRDHFERGRPMFRVTERGKAVIAEASRDPGNKDGYLAHVAQWLPADGIARSYVDEALETHRRRCDRAAAFLIGGATESLTRRLAESINALGGADPNLRHRNISTVITAMQAIVNGWIGNPPHGVQPMARDLEERWRGIYPSLAHFIRSTRNDAGHPVKLDNVSHADAHAMFLAFTCLAEMLHDVGEWLTPGQWK